MIFKCGKKRKALFTPYQIYRKHRIKEFSNLHDDPVTAAKIRLDWEALTPNSKHRYKIEAETCLTHAPVVEADIIKVLKGTNGSITWQKLEVKVASSSRVNGTKLVSRETIQRHVMGLANSMYQSTRMHPKLDSSHKKRRFDWTIAFWMFLNAAKLTAAKAQILLVHMDETWFFSLVVQRKNLNIPCYGVAPVDHHIPESHLQNDDYCFNRLQTLRKWRGEGRYRPQTCI
jgi:hypothetical protein